MPGDRVDWKELRRSTEAKRRDERRPQVERALQMAEVAAGLATSPEWLVFHQHLQALIEDAETLYQGIVEAARQDRSFDPALMAAHKARQQKAWIRLETLRECQKIPQTLQDAAKSAAETA